MSVDAVTGKIIQNRVNDKINYQTSFTDFTTFVEYCRYLKKIGPVASQKVNKVCGKRRSEFTPSWKNDKSDSHAKISLLQYGLIELNEQNYYVVSEIGDRFIALFDDDNNLVADREEFLNVTFDMICIWHQEGNGFDIHPGKMIIRLMLEPELHGYFTDQDLACICNDTDNRLDSQYEEIKEKVIAFRESGVIYTREEKKKTYTLLTGYANNWNIFELDEKSTNEIKIVHLCDDFRQLAIKRLSVMTEDKVPTDDELKTLIRGTDELSKSISDWEVKYGIDGRVLVTHFTKVKQVQDAFRNRLMAYYGRCCMMCGIRNKEMLIASHIKRDADCETIEEKIDKDNGFLLCANHDKLFDHYLITFDFMDGKIKISKSLSDEEIKILMLDPDYTLPEELLTDNRRDYLLYHNDEYEKRESERSAAV